AHPAVGHHRQRRMPAIVRDLVPDALRHLDGVELLPLGDRVLGAVDQDGRHFSSCRLLVASCRFFAASGFPSISRSSPIAQVLLTTCKCKPAIEDAGIPCATFSWRGVTSAAADWCCRM